MRGSDPLASPEVSIQRVYAYVAYRIGAGPDAEDVTSTVIERAVRYRTSYDALRGDPVSWLIGIARSCVADHVRNLTAPDELRDAPDDHPSLESEAVMRLGVNDAIATLDDRDRELVALRYGADLSAREIGRLLGMRTNAVEVALHRMRSRLRRELERSGYAGAPRHGLTVARPVSEPSG